MTRVLVTGGTGFIGQHLVSALAKSGRQVRVLDLRSPHCAVSEVQYVQGSVIDPGAVNEALADVDEVYHLAGLPGMWVPQKADFDAVNRHGTEVVIMAARKKGITRFLHCSTESILGVRRRAAEPTTSACCHRRKCPAFIHARKCWPSGLRRRLRRPGFRW